MVARHQPVKFAAMEAHFDTQRGAPILVGGWADEEREETRYAIKIPYLLSILAFDDPHAEVKGLKEVPRADRPPVAIVHIAFDVMVGCGTVLAGVMLGPMVDAMVTPEGVAEMVRRGRIRRAPGGATAAPPVIIASPATGMESAPLPPAEAPLPGSTMPSPPVGDASAKLPQLEMGYSGLNRFVVTFSVASGGEKEKPFGLIFFREGLFGWKLSEVRLPPSR